MSRPRRMEPPASTTASLLAGKRPYMTKDGIAALGGRYQVQRVLGQGSMGVVLCAHDPMLERDVAIKVVRPDVFSIPGVHEAFAREAKAMARCKHPNVVRIHEFGQHDGAFFFAMEYIDGSDLETWLETQVLPLSIDQAMGIIEPLCRGTRAIHDAGAVHRDLKPGNVLMGPAHRVAISDLGLSVFVDDPRLREHLSGGTPEYMAPEVARRDTLPPELVKAGDIYALGVMAYELLVGRLPFDDDDPNRIMEMQVSASVPVPSQVNPALPANFDAPLIAALAKDPRVRTGSATELRRALLDAVSASDPSTQLRERSFDVLVVDDDPDMLDWLDVHLSSRFPRATIRRALGGIKGYEALREKMPDIVISDLDMPGIDGTQLCTVLRDLEGGLTVPLIVVTGVGGALDWAKLQALGANGFLVKPLDGDALASLMGSVMP